MNEEAHHQPEPAAACRCFTVSYYFLAIEQELGMDGNFAEVSLLVCPHCGQHWLRYFYEIEAFTASGRWYLGPISAEQASHLSATNAREILESLPWYFYGGSYFGGSAGKAAGGIFI